MKLHNRTIRGIDGNWEHIMEKHGVSEAEVVSAFRSITLRPKRNKRAGRADYLVVGRAFSGKLLRVCYSWDDEKPGWSWIHTAF